jgi:hypothetical protein
MQVILKLLLHKRCAVDRENNGFGGSHINKVKICIKNSMVASDKV